jgi:hypothetical protein
MKQTPGTELEVLAIARKSLAHYIFPLSVQGISSYF